MHQNFLIDLLAKHLSKHCHTNILTSQVILMKFEGLGTVLSNGFKDHQTLKFSTKPITLIKAIALSRRLLFVPKVVPWAIYQMHMQVQEQKLLTEDTAIPAPFTPGYSVLFDKRLNVQNLFFRYKVTARIPRFVRSKRQLTASEAAVGKRIARARINVERNWSVKRVSVTRSYFTIKSSWSCRWNMNNCMCHNQYPTTTC